MTITRIRGLITPFIAAHEPPSKLKAHPTSTPRTSSCLRMALATLCRDLAPKKLSWTELVMRVWCWRPAYLARNTQKPGLIRGMWLSRMSTATSDTCTYPTARFHSSGPWMNDSTFVSQGGPERPPDTKANLQTLGSRLRRAINENVVLGSRGAEPTSKHCKPNHVSLSFLHSMK